MLRRHWNEAVHPKDLVLILGDITLETPVFYEMLDHLNGRKKVVMGNHDSPKHCRKLLEHVEQVCGSIEYKRGVILTHIPIHESQMGRFWLNIHGHVHSESLDDNRYVNVSAEAVDYTPVDIHQLIKRSKDDRKNL
jgi:calcineurin-like phosphoesterase family protein